MARTFQKENTDKRKSKDGQWVSGFERSQPGKGDHDLEESSQRERGEYASSQLETNSKHYSSSLKFTGNPTAQSI